MKITMKIMARNEIQIGDIQMKREFFSEISGRSRQSRFFEVVLNIIELSPKYNSESGKKTQRTTKISLLEHNKQTVCYPYLNAINKQSEKTNFFVK